MSANNYILINRKHFDVTVRNADTGGVEYKIGKGKNLEDAIDKAQEHVPFVEYGINFTEK